MLFMIHRSTWFFSQRRMLAEDSQGAHTPALGAPVSLGGQGKGALHDLQGIRFTWQHLKGKTCMTTRVHLSPFTSGFLPSETAIKAYWGLSRALMTAIHTANSLS